MLIDYIAGIIETFLNEQKEKHNMLKIIFPLLSIVIIVGFIIYIFNNF